MNILRRIKKLFETKQEILEKTPEDISLSEMPSRIKIKDDEITESKNNIMENLLKIATSFEKEIQDKIASLEKIDVSQIKEHERIKMVVKDNLNFYISQLRKIAYNINIIQEKDLEKYVNALSKLMNEFDAASKIPYEKATILIGEELAKTKEIIKLFVINFNKIVNENKRVFNEDKLCKEINKLLLESNQLNNVISETNDIISKIKINIEEGRLESKILKSKLENVINSEDYKNEIAKKIEYKNSLDLLEKELQQIKENINLKALLKKFHHDKKADQFVRNYLADFKDSLKNDKELKIISLIDQKEEALIIKIRRVREKLLGLIYPIQSKTEIELMIIKGKIKEKDFIVNDLESNLSSEIKKKDKLLIKGENIHQEIIEKAKNLLK